MDEIKALSIGAVLWDRIGDKEYIGGAPLNLAAHLAQCGVQSALLTRVGADEAGGRARIEMERLGLQQGFTQIDPMHPTGWAAVDLSEPDGPRYTFPQNPAYDFIEADEDTLAQITAAHVAVVCFGTMEQINPVTRHTIHTVIETVQPPRVFFDINIRRDFYPKEILHRSLAVSTLVKMNEEEARFVPVRLYGQEMTEAQLANRLQAEYPVELVVITCGDRGCTLYASGERTDVPSLPVTVADTVGAGDAFSAGLLFELCRGRTPIEAAKVANALGAFVASRPGAVPEYTDEIRRLLR